MNLLTAHKKFFRSSEKGLVLRNSKGFTLIELLVVIGILGILAASLVATIDPFEQLKKANDSKTQNVAVEFQTGVVRYFTSQNAFPWDVAGDCQTDTGATPVGTGYDIDPDVVNPLPTLETAVSCVDALIGVGELKQSFTDITGALENVSISEENSVLVACYQPTSRAGQKDKSTKYTDTAGTVDAAPLNDPAACLSRGGNATCYWCTK